MVELPDLGPRTRNTCSQYTTTLRMGQGFVRHDRYDIVALRRLGIRGKALSLLIVGNRRLQSLIEGDGGLPAEHILRCG